LIIHIFGLIFFFSLCEKKYIKKNSIILFIIILLYFSLILISKNHDDFPYYHHSLALNLVDQKIQFGLGNFNLGYRHHSSIIHLMSLTYLPGYNFYLFNYVNFLFFIFISYLLYKNIKKNIGKKNFIFFFSLFYFILINVKFKRLAEFGTDLSGQLLLILLFLIIFETLISKKNLSEKYYAIFIILFLTFTFKVTYVIYSVILLLLLLINQKKQFLKFIFENNKFTIFLAFFLFLYMFQNFAYTGCFVYPISETCWFKDLNWTLTLDEIDQMKLHLESWAKAGTTPNYVVENRSEYIMGINWVPNWYKNYFLFKGLEFILLNIFIFSILFLLIFLPYKFNKRIKFKKEYKLLLIINFIVLFIWFFKHPSLRYGGYFPVSLFFVTLSSWLFSNLKIVNVKYLKNKINFLIILSLIIFNVFNYNRIIKELKREDIYKYSNFPFFSFDDKKLKQNKINLNNLKKSYKYGYIFYLNE
jgi:hypothetical protein